MQSELLSERYGVRAQGSKKRNQVLALIAVIVMTLIAAWFGFANYSPVSHNDIGYRVLSDYRVEVDFELTKPRSETVRCSFQALNNQFAKVGWIELEFGPSDSDTLRHTISFSTTELAVTGLVDTCRLR
jgi:hypothetical protein